MNLPHVSSSLTHTDTDDTVSTRARTLHLSAVDANEKPVIVVDASQDTQTAREDTRTRTCATTSTNERRRKATSPGVHYACPVCTNKEDSKQHGKKWSTHHLLRAGDRPTLLLFPATIQETKTKYTSPEEARGNKSAQPASSALGLTRTIPCAASCPHPSGGDQTAVAHSSVRGPTPYGHRNTRGPRQVSSIMPHPAT